MASAAPLDGVSLPSVLERAKIACLPSTAYYIPDFIGEQEEKIILDKVRLPHVPSIVMWA
jgi:alkylated DNA repair protein alkB family protein 6